LRFPFERVDGAVTGDVERSTSGTVAVDAAEGVA
jgi:hypothetical protein